MYRKYENGGLNLQDSDTKMKTFRSMWISELLNCDPNWQTRDFKEFETDASNKYDNCIKNEFYKNLIKTWRLLKIILKPSKLQDIRRDGVFDNLLLVDENGKCFK